MRRVPAALVRALRASLVLAVSLVYLSYVFDIYHGVFWTAGLGDWIDPYFINYLLEHWYHALSTFSDPFSPPMFYPAQKTLGYSHSLILYAPFYVPVRLFFHPFQAYSLALLIVIETGIVCLYVIFRRFLQLSFLESLLLTAFFFSSPNVINGTIGVWSQRASVFLVPPIVLIGLISYHRPPGRVRFVTAAIAGFLAALLFPHDFYSGFFAFFFAGVGLAAWVWTERRISVLRLFRLHHLRPVERMALSATLILAAWTFYLWSSPGVRIRIAGIRISSQDWRRPALLLVVAVVAFVWLRGARRVGADLKQGLQRGRAEAWSWAWAWPLALGAVTGVAVFFWGYLAAYSEHPRFPEQDLLNQIRVRAWSGWIRAFQDLNAYDTTRSFKLVAIAAILACIPWLALDRKTRWYVWWCAIVSVVVFLMPIRVDGLSIWLSFFRYAPGFGVIRDPTRVIYLYELAFILAAALCLTRFRQQPAYRAGVCLLFAYFLITDHRVDKLGYERSRAIFQRWVEAPIAIDPACTSFYVKRASPEYMLRSPNMWALYAGDSMFIALNHRLPTLNGYSAWQPDGWELANPPEPTYGERVRAWIQKNNLRNVCELDIEARTMRVAAMN